MQKKTIAVTVENQPGVLARVSGLFAGRGFNIESLAVGETEDETMSRMTIVASGDELVLEQIIKQLNKLIDVIKVVDLHDEPFIARELALVKVNTEGRSKEEIMNVVNIYRAKVLDVAPDAFVVEVTGTDEKIKSFIGIMGEYGIKEMSRTGTIAMTRTKKTQETNRKEK
ncbi:MAG: acetolactate synthase small subunit [Spirochaetia bacterium]|nr:acetolactate synthase small subunit [Spirochaetia bacterium]